MLCSLLTWECHGLTLFLCSSLRTFFMSQKSSVLKVSVPTGVGYPQSPLVCLLWFPSSPFLFQGRPNSLSFLLSWSIAVTLPVWGRGSVCGEGPWGFTRICSSNKISPGALCPFLAPASLLTSTGLGTPQRAWSPRVSPAVPACASSLRVSIVFCI